MSGVKTSPLRRVESEKSFEKNKITEVNPQVFQKMVTNEGLSIAQMNELGVKVVLFFSSSLGKSNFAKVSVSILSRYHR